MFSKLKERGLNTSDLKLVAIIAMTIDPDFKESGMYASFI